MRVSRGTFETERNAITAWFDALPSRLKQMSGGLSEFLEAVEACKIFVVADDRKTVGIFYGRMVEKDVMDAHYISPRHQDADTLQDVVKAFARYIPRHAKRLSLDLFPFQRQLKTAVESANGHFTGWTIHKDGAVVQRYVWEASGDTTQRAFGSRFIV